MSLYRIIVCSVIIGSSFWAEAQEVIPKKLQIGSEVTDQEIAIWNTDVKPNGEGLPYGQGTVEEGEKIFIQKCLMCHGPEGKNGPYPQLVGRSPNDEFIFGSNHRLPRTVGNYWPYATTLYDYILRAMPQLEPGSLNAEEVYSLTAYILYLNKIIPADAVMNAESLPSVKMPALDRFYIEVK